MSLLRKKKVIPRGHLWQLHALGYLETVSFIDAECCHLLNCVHNRTCPICALQLKNVWGFEELQVCKMACISILFICLNYLMLDELESHKVIP